MIASLPMYDRPETAEANDKLWSGMAERIGSDAPLTRDIDDMFEHWLDPQLALSQTCGFPYRARLAGHVTLLATPVLDLECAAGHYFSVIIIRREDRGRQLEDITKPRVAYNEALSQSGWAALHGHLSNVGITTFEAIETGAHRASAQAVAEGRADLAAIDALTWNMMKRWDRVTDMLCVVEQTAPTPTLPYICATGLNADQMRAAFEASFDALSSGDRMVLGIKGLITVPHELYMNVPIPPPPPAVSSS